MRTKVLTLIIAASISAVTLYAVDATQTQNPSSDVSQVTESAQQKMADCPKNMSKEDCKKMMESKDKNMDMSKCQKKMKKQCEKMQKMQCKGKMMTGSDTGDSLKKADNAPSDSAATNAQ